MIEISRIALAFLGLTTLISLTFSGLAHANEAKNLSANLESSPMSRSHVFQDNTSKQIAHIGAKNIEKQSRDLISSLTVKANINGMWKSSEGTITFSESEDPVGKVSGTYTQDNGVIAGWINGDNVLNGYWIEDKSNQRCSTALNGRYYWGRVRFSFTSVYKPYTFDGAWGYCNSEPTTRWTGAKLTK
jgi:hypothetical protein